MRARANDSGFQQAIEKSKGTIYRICLSYANTKVEVEDLYQEILIAVWKSMGNFRNESSWNTFVFRIAVNTAIKFRVKENKVGSIMSASGTLPDLPATQHEDEGEFQLQALHRAIRQLNDPDRLLVSMMLEDLSYKEIAEVLQSDINAVGVRINRVKKKLSTLLNVSYE